MHHWPLRTNTPPTTIQTTKGLDKRPSTLTTRPWDLATKASHHACVARLAAAHVPSPHCAVAPPAHRCGAGRHIAPGPDRTNATRAGSGLVQQRIRQADDRGQLTGCERERLAAIPAFGRDATGMLAALTVRLNLADPDRRWAVGSFFWDPLSRVAEPGYDPGVTRTTIIDRRTRPMAAWHGNAFPTAMTSSQRSRTRSSGWPTSSITRSEP